MDTHSDSGERMSYQTPEIRSLGTIADITASGTSGTFDSFGYSESGGHNPGGS
jgi:hypothetical protein